MKNTLQTLGWFQDRIGVRIFRDYNGCKCDTCFDILRDGLVVGDEPHAKYLFDIQNEYANDGILLNYRNKQ